MDTTDVSYKKTMNVSMCLPQLDLHMWLPPQDLGGTQGVPSMWPPRPCLYISLPGFPHFFLPFLLVWSSLSLSIHHKPLAQAQAQAFGSVFWFRKLSPSSQAKPKLLPSLLAHFWSEPRPLAQGQVQASGPAQLLAQCQSHDTSGPGSWAGLSCSGSGPWSRPPWARPQAQGRARSVR